MKSRIWTNFVPIAKLKNSNLSNEEWLKYHNTLIQDFQWLLSLPHNCFWSQVVHDPGVRSSLSSYLENAPRSYDTEIFTLTSEQQKVLFDLNAVIFKVYVRLMTSKESQENYLCSAVHGKALYDNFIIDIPTIFDLCLLYGYNNQVTKNVLMKSLHHIFDIQPKYYMDLECALQEKIIQELSGRFLNCSLSEGTADKNESEHYKDFILFLFEIVLSLHTLMDLVPHVVNLLQTKTFEKTIAVFYELVIPEIFNNIFKIRESELRHNLYKKLNSARYYLLNIVKMIMTSRISAISVKPNCNWAEEAASSYVYVLSEIVLNSKFILDYHTFHPSLEKDLDVLGNLFPKQLDLKKRNHIIEAINGSFENKSCRKINSSSKELHLYFKDKKDDTAQILNLLIKEIKMVLPELSDSFLAECIKYYKFDKEQVLNAILENDIPEELSEIYRLGNSLSLPGNVLKVNNASKIKEFDKAEVEFELLSKHNRHVSSAYKGKRRGPHKNLHELLNDKDEVKALKHIYLDRYSNIDESIEYDDEYDDSYDGINDKLLGDADNDSKIKPLVIPRLLDTEDYEEEESDLGETDNPNNFTTNPEETRAKIAMNKAEKFEEKRNRDVIGKPKGQGQEKEVLRNRQYKNAHKSSNRKAGFQRKMRQGMYPT